MNKYTLNFTYTTADEQRNTFCGETQNNAEFSLNEIHLKPGNYRVIDGQLCQIISSSPSNLKKQFDLLSK